MEPLAAHPQYHDVLAAYLEGKTYRQIAKALEVAPSLIVRVFNDADVPLKDESLSPDITKESLLSLSDAQLDILLAAKPADQPAALGGLLRQAAVATAEVAFAADQEVVASNAAALEADLGARIDPTWLATDPEIALLCARARIPQREQVEGGEKICSQPLLRMANEAFAVYEAGWREALMGILKTRVTNPGAEQLMAMGLGENRHMTVLREQLDAFIDGYGTTPGHRIPLLEALLGVTAKWKMPKEVTEALAARDAWQRRMAVSDQVPQEVAKNAVE